MAGVSNANGPSPGSDTNPTLIGVDDCERVSRDVSAALDVADRIPNTYQLEVSSPGLDRPLRRERDFARFVGESARLRLEAGVEGRRNFSGTIRGAKDGRVEIACDGRSYELPIDDIVRGELGAGLGARIQSECLMNEGAALGLVLDQVSKDKNIDRTVLVETLEQAILTAAKRAFGIQREMEAKFNEEIGRVDLFQIIIIVEAITAGNEGKEVLLADAQRFGLKADPGDELLFQIFYDEKDQAKAEEQDAKYGELLKLNRA